MRRAVLTGAIAALLAPVAALAQAGADGRITFEPGPFAATGQCAAAPAPSSPADPAALPPAARTYGPIAGPPGIGTAPSGDWCADAATRRAADRDAPSRYAIDRSGTEGNAGRNCRETPGGIRCTWSRSSDPAVTDENNPARQAVERELDRLSRPPN